MNIPGSNLVLSKFGPQGLAGSETIETHCSMERAALLPR